MTPSVHPWNRQWPCWCLGLLLASCSTPTAVRTSDEGVKLTSPRRPNQPNHPNYASVLIADVPHVRQKPDFCGEAVTESWLKALGSSVSQDEVFALSGMNPERGMGATTRELAVALERLGFEVGPVFGKASAESADDLEKQFAALHADLLQRIPSIVCMHYSDKPATTEHFRLVLGYDATTDEVVYHEPAAANAAYQRMSRQQFLALWPLKYDPKLWTVIRLRLAGTPKGPTATTGTLATPTLIRTTQAEYAQHIMRLREGKGRGFNVILEPPFVVLGDGSSTELRAVATRTVRWAVGHLKRDFFSKDPARILDIWLFRDASSYESNVLRLFGSSPTTPYGYYSSEHDALVMNIATGGGTLVHEIVHPYIEANFPDCPAWFNEGLGSLYEQSAERDGHIIGLTNWRLAGLQKRITRGKLASFPTLLSTTTRQFYDDDSGGNYAQARYLLYYLQEKGLLVRYYREFFEHRASDPTGLTTLKRVLDEPDIEAFQKRWETWVMRLQFPEGGP
ncbi:MAG: C39 family peptidase [Polyangiaceae bacterium]